MNADVVLNVTRLGEDAGAAFKQTSKPARVHAGAVIVDLLGQILAIAGHLGRVLVFL